MKLLVGFRKIIFDRITILGFGLAFIEIIIFYLLIKLGTPLQEEALPLHYNVYFGIDLIGPGRGYLIPVALSLLIGLVNLVLATWAIERELLAARLLAWFSFWLISFTLFATLITQWILL